MIKILLPCKISGDFDNSVNNLMGVRMSVSTPMLYYSEYRDMLNRVNGISARRTELKLLEGKSFIRLAN